MYLYNRYNLEVHNMNLDETALSIGYYTLWYKLEHSRAQHNLHSFKNRNLPRSEDWFPWHMYSVC